MRMGSRGVIMTVREYLLKPILIGTGIDNYRQLKSTMDVMINSNIAFSSPVVSQLLVIVDNRLIG